MLTIENVTKKYGDFLALENINLSLDNGVYGLLAPNGAGKTTLMKMIVTLLFPNEGQILWNGEEIIKMDEKYRALIGYLPQDFGYYPNNTPGEFLRYAAALQKIPKGKVANLIDELLNHVGLFEVGDKKLKKFSGGMIQRLGIAVSLINNPKILILDEPTAGLDPRERVRFRNLIHSLSKDRIVILSTHIVSDVETIAKEIIMIKNKRLYSKDTPHSILGDFKGKVFLVPSDYKLSKGDLILSEVSENNESKLRILTNFRPENGMEISSTLEDAFLSIYREDV